MSYIISASAPFLSVPFLKSLINIHQETVHYIFCLKHLRTHYESTHTFSGNTNQDRSYERLFNTLYTRDSRIIPQTPDTPYIHHGVNIRHRLHCKKNRYFTEPQKKVRQMTKSLQMCSKFQKQNKKICRTFKGSYRVPK